MKLRLTILFLLIGFNTIIAQRQPATRGFIGVKFGLAHYTLDGSEADLRTRGSAVVHARSGVEVGALAKIEFYGLVYLKTEVNYLQKGGHIKGGGWLYQDPVEVNYLNMPVLLGFTPGKSKRIAFSVEGGFSLNKLRSSINTYSQDIVSSYSSVTNNSIWSYVAGAEFSFDLSRQFQIFLNYRFSKDLDFFHARQSSQSRPSYELWNKGESVTLGVYYHPLRKYD